MYHIITNPKASSGKGVKILEQIKKILKKENIIYKGYSLKSAEETTELVRKLTASGREEECHIVVLGGDGTLNAVINGIVDFEHTTLSCIRTGSGNDFARNVGVAKNAAKAIRHLIYDTEEMTLDYGVATYMAENESHQRRFIISSGVGYDADICEEVAHSRLKKVLNRVGLGKLVYVLIGIKQIFTRINAGAVVRLDDEEYDIPALFFTVGMIHEKEGGGVPFCPEANPTDGLLDVCLVKSMPKWKLLLAVTMVYMKKHFLFQNITAHRCKKMQVELREPQWFHIDGETSCKIAQIQMECRTGLRFRK